MTAPDSYTLTIRDGSDGSDLVGVVTLVDISPGGVRRFLDATTLMLMRTLPRSTAATFADIVELVTRLIGGCPPEEGRKILGELIANSQAFTSHLLALSGNVLVDDPDLWGDYDEDEPPF